MRARFCLCCLVAVVGLTMLAGCGTTLNLLSTSVQLRSGDPSAETWYAADSLYLGSPGRLAASFSWEDAGSAGTHEYWWEIHKAGQCVRKETKQSVMFASSPQMIWVTLDTAAFGVGDFQGKVYLDGDLAATVPFTIRRAR